MKKIFISAILFVAINGFAIACSTSPAAVRESKVDLISLEGKAIITIAVPHYSDAKEISAFTSGITAVTGSLKTLPTVPEDIKTKTKEVVNSTLMESNATVEVIITTLNKLGKFDYLLLVTSEQTQVSATIMGFPISSQGGVTVNAKLYDASTKTFISQASTPGVTEAPAGLPEADKAKLAAISNAARNGIKALLEK
ncbi:MAG: hypothetical protein MH321_14690 [Leptospiraceae bacterium]|nr:hypothetical protein [Leptospiraceae bacterium]